MPNLRRCYGPGNLHFITFSCYRQLRLLGSGRRRDLLLGKFGDRRDIPISGYHREGDLRGIRQWKAGTDRHVPLFLGSYAIEGTVSTGTLVAADVVLRRH